MLMSMHLLNDNTDELKAFDELVESRESKKK